MTRQQRLTLVATILGSTIVFLDSTVVNVALPAISESLDSALAGQQWVVEAYLLTLVSLLLVGGSLGDRFGRRRIFTFGLVAFGATSALCAVAPSVEFLVGARALQGIAGALLVPGSLALIAATFEGGARGRAVGIWTAWTGIATVIGPAGGGALIEAFSWRAIFWVNVPLVALTLWIAIRAVEESRDPEATGAVDWLGIGLSAVGLAGPVFALIEQPIHGWDAAIVRVPLAVGIPCLVLFVAHEARSRQPMLQLSLFRIRNFWVANLTTFTAYAGLIGGLFFLTIFLQQVAGYSPIEAGLATTPVSLTLFALSPRFGRFASAVGPRLPMAAGPIVAGIGLLLLLRIDAGGEYVADVLPGVLLFSLGLAATVAPLTATVLDSVDERHVGIASGANNAIARVAGLLAIAVLGAVISASFSAQIDRKIETEPNSLGPGMLNALAAASDEPLRLPDGEGLGRSEAVLVRHLVATASTSAFHLGMLLAGLLMVAGGAVAGFGIQNRPRGPDVVPTRAGAAA